MSKKLNKPNEPPINRRDPAWQERDIRVYFLFESIKKEEPEMSPEELKWRNSGQFGMIDGGMGNIKQNYKDRIVKTILPYAKRVGYQKAYDVFSAIKLQMASGSSYSNLNNRLRAGQTTVRVPLIDEAFSVFPKNKQNVLYRGVSKEFWGTLKEGEYFVDGAYASASTKQSVARHFATRRGKGGILVLNNVSGMGLDLSFFEQYEDYGEDEVLLPRGLKYEIQSIRDNIAQVKVTK